MLQHIFAEFQAHSLVF